MHVLVGQGPQEDLFYYDHPYFGQLFLAGVLWLVGYPNVVHPSIGDIGSIERLYLLPRVLMALLAVVDTFLIYKIGERRYNSNVAFIASVLFAVMPLTLLLRRVWLEPIQLPFLLSSIFFVVYSTTQDPEKPNDYNAKKKYTVLILLSGIFLGLAIFTKIPAFTMIPLVGFLVYKKSAKSKKLKMLGIWFIPVIAIPLSWPMYAIYMDQFGHWLDTCFWQLHRAGSTLFFSIAYDFNIDPGLIGLGLAGVIFAAIKKDLFILIWIIPFVTFLYFIGFVSYWHLLPTLPLFCIAASTMIVDVSNRINIKRIQQILPLGIIFGMAVFGLIFTVQLITTNVNSHYFQAAAFVTEYLANSNYQNKSDDPMIIISDPSYEWIPKYVFHFDNIYKNYFYFGNVGEINGKVLLVVDQGFVRAMLKNDETANQLQEIYNNSNIIVTFGERYSFDKVTIREYDSKDK